MSKEQGDKIINLLEWIAVWTFLTMLSSCSHR